MSYSKRYAPQGQRLGESQVSMPTESASSNAMRASQLPPAPAPAPSMLDLAAREIREGGGYSSDAEEDGGFSFLDSPADGVSYVDFPDGEGLSNADGPDESAVPDGEGRSCLDSPDEGVSYVDFPDGEGLSNADGPDESATSGGGAPQGEGFSFLDTPSESLFSYLHGFGRDSGDRSPEARAESPTRAEPRDDAAQEQSKQKEYPPLWRDRLRYGFDLGGTRRDDEEQLNVDILRMEGGVFEGEGGKYGDYASANGFGVTIDPTKEYVPGTEGGGFWGSHKHFDAGYERSLDLSPGERALNVGYRADVASGELGYRTISDQRGDDRGLKVGGALGVTSGGLRLTESDADQDGTTEYGLGVSAPFGPAGLSMDMSSETLVEDLLSGFLPLEGIGGRMALDYMGWGEYRPSAWLGYGPDRGDKAETRDSTENTP